MRTKQLLAALAASTLLATAVAGQVRGEVSVNINAYLPAPPGVHVYVDAGRPYYVEHERRVYMKKKPKKAKHHTYKHENHGHKHGHNKH